MRAGALAAVFAHYGVDIPEGYGEVSALCPVHGEHRPSLRVNLEKGVAFCNACEFKGGPIHLVMAMESCSRTDALQRLEVIYRASGLQAQSAPRRYQRPSEGRATTTGRRYVPPGRRST